MVCSRSVRLRAHPTPARRSFDEDQVLLQSGRCQRILLAAILANSIERMDRHIHWVELRAEWRRSYCQTTMSSLLKLETYRKRCWLPEHTSLNVNGSGLLR